MEGILVDGSAIIFEWDKRSHDDRSKAKKPIPKNPNPEPKEKENTNEISLADLVVKIEEKTKEVTKLKKEMTEITRKYLH